MPIEFDRREEPYFSRFLATTEDGKYLRTETSKNFSKEKLNLEERAFKVSRLLIVLGIILKKEADYRATQEGKFNPKSTSFNHYKDLWALYREWLQLRRGENKHTNRPFFESVVGPPYQQQSTEVEPGTREWDTDSIHAAIDVATTYEELARFQTYISVLEEQVSNLEQHVLPLVTYHDSATVIEGEWVVISDPLQLPKP